MIEREIADVEDFAMMICGSMGRTI